MNETEAAYARRLDILKSAGEVEWWGFEVITLTLVNKDGKRCRYTPDFCVLLANGRIEFHETKGFERDDAIVKFKWASEALPWARFVMLKKKGEGWERIREYGP